MENFPGHTTLQLLREVQRTETENRIRTEQFEDRVIFMSMYSDIDWARGENEQTCISNSLEVKAYANRFPERSLVIPRTRNRRTMVWNAHLQAKRFVEPLCRNDGASSPRKWTS